MFYFQTLASCQPLHPRILVIIPRTPVSPVLLMGARLHLGSVSVFHHVPVAPPQVSPTQLYILRFLLELLLGSCGPETQPTAPQRPPAQSRVLEGSRYSHCYYNINHFPCRIRASASSSPVLAAEDELLHICSCLVDVTLLLFSAMFGVVSGGATFYTILSRVDSLSLNFFILSSTSWFPVASPPIEDGLPFPPLGSPSRGLGRDLQEGRIQPSVDL